MTPKEMGELILEWAKNRTEPFTTADAFNEIDSAQNVAEISNGLGLLYRKGRIARKKIDGLRFAYMLPGIASEEYETTQPDGMGVARALINDMQGEHETAAKTPVNEAPAPEAGATEKGAEKPESQNAEAGCVFFVPPQTVEIKIPENFVLSLQTPGGLVITIKTGIL